MGNKARLLLVCFFACLSLQAQERKPVPANKGLVSDYANLLKPDEVASLTQKLRDYEDSTSTQIAVVIEKSLNGRDKFDRAMDFGRQWEVGQKGKNNGVVFYIAADDHKIFILTANNTQGALNDGKVGEAIIRQEISPLFKQGRYYEGINNGIDAIAAALAGEFKADPKKREGTGTFGTLIIIFIIMIVLFIISKRKGGGGTGGYSGSGPYWFPPIGGGGSGGWGGGGGDSGGSSWGGFGGGGGFDGGGAGGDW